MGNGLSSGQFLCPADSFFVGLPIPVTPLGEGLLPGRTYFVLPAARFSFSTSSSKAPVLTAATLASLSAATGNKKRASLAGPGECPFEYVKGAEDGAAPLIRVLPSFIEMVITRDGVNGAASAGRRGTGSKCGGVAGAHGAVQHAGAEEALRAAGRGEEPAVVTAAGDDIGAQQEAGVPLPVAGQAS